MLAPTPDELSAIFDEYGESRMGNRDSRAELISKGPVTCRQKAISARGRGCSWLIPTTTFWPMAWNSVCGQETWSDFIH
jgi:hypothetical protein